MGKKKRRTTSCCDCIALDAGNQAYAGEKAALAEAERLRQENMTLRADYADLDTRYGEESDECAVLMLECERMCARIAELEEQLAQPAPMVTTRIVVDTEVWYRENTTPPPEYYE